jgi:hypothetical protein
LCQFVGFVSFYDESLAPVQGLRQLVEQCFRVLEIGGIEALGESVVDRSQQVVRALQAAQQMAEMARQWEQVTANALDDLEDNPEPCAVLDGVFA